VLLGSLSFRSVNKREFDIGLEDDLTSLNEVKLRVHSFKWSNVKLVGVIKLDSLES